MSRTENLTCPYNTCRKKFQKPLLLTDSSKIPRETYYACPNCHSRLEIVLKNQGNLKAISVKASDDPAKTPTQNSTLPNCPHYLGYLRTLPNNAQIPDECTICPQIMRCFAKHT